MKARPDEADAGDRVVMQIEFLRFAKNLRRTLQQSRSDAWRIARLTSLGSEFVHTNKK